MRIAITGARGRLAPLVARHLASAGHEVALYSRERGENIAQIGNLPSSIDETDAIVHCAWSSLPLTAEKNPENLKSADLPLLEKLVAASADKPFLFLSTAAVYGNTAETPANEQFPPAPLGRYAAGKLEAEKLIPATGTVLRVSNLIGERCDPLRPQGILPRLIEAARTGGEITIWGDGHATKDYLHCNDLMDAITRVLEGNLLGTFNAASGTSASVLELIALVERLTGRSIAISHVPAYDWDVRHSKIDSSKLRAAAAWEPKYSVEHAVAEVIARFDELT
jgi:UDP-glucose 4-epimerase